MYLLRLKTSIAGKGWVLNHNDVVLWEDETEAQRLVDRNAADLLARGDIADSRCAALIRKEESNSRPVVKIVDLYARSRRLVAAEEAEAKAREAEFQRRKPAYETPSPAPTVS